jgi:hypothetical protein
VSRNGAGFAARFRRRNLGTFRTVEEASATHEKALAEFVGVSERDAAGYSTTGRPRAKFLVDDEFVALVSADAWNLTPRGYVQRSASKKFGRKTVLLHRHVWSLAGRVVPVGLSIDHINRDRTDCRLRNLRLATRRMQCMNRIDMPKRGDLPAGVTLDYEGVRGGKLFLARCCGSYLGCFASVEAASEAYRSAFTAAWEEEERLVREAILNCENGPIYIRTAQ